MIAGLFAGQASATIERFKHKAVRAQIQPTKIPGPGTARATKLFGRHHVYGLGATAPVHDLPSGGRRIPDPGQFVSLLGRILEPAVLCHGGL